MTRPSLSRATPVAVLLSGCALLGAGLAGVARVDAPLSAAATERPPAVERGVDMTWHHRDGDCPPKRHDRRT